MNAHGTSLPLIPSFYSNGQISLQPARIKCAEIIPQIVHFQYAGFQLHVKAQPALPVTIHQFQETLLFIDVPVKSVCP